MAAIAGVCALAVAAGPAFGAAERHPHTGKLPGYPAIRGVVPVLADTLPSTIDWMKLYVLRIRWLGLPPAMSTSALVMYRSAPFGLTYQ